MWPPDKGRSAVVFASSTSKCLYKYFTHVINNKMVSDFEIPTVEQFEDPPRDVPKSPDGLNVALGVEAEIAMTSAGLGRTSERITTAAPLAKPAPPKELEADFELPRSVSALATTGTLGDQSSDESGAPVKSEEAVSNEAEAPEPPRPADAGNGEDPPEDPPQNADESGDRDPEEEPTLHRDRRLVTSWRENGNEQAAAELIKAYDDRLSTLAKTIAEAMPGDPSISHEDLVQEGRAELLQRATTWDVTRTRPLFSDNRNNIQRAMVNLAASQGFPVSTKGDGIGYLNQLDESEDWHMRVPYREPPTDRDLVQELEIPLRAEREGTMDVGVVRRLANLTVNVQSLDEGPTEVNDPTTLEEPTTQTLEDSSRLTSPTSQDPENDIAYREPLDQAQKEQLAKVEEHLDDYAKSAKISSAREQGVVTLYGRAEGKSYAEISKEMPGKGDEQKPDPAVLVQQAREAARWVRDKMQKAEPAEANQAQASGSAPSEQQRFTADLDLVGRHKWGDRSALAKLSDMRRNLTDRLFDEYRGKLPAYVNLYQAIDRGTAGFFTAAHQWAQDPAISLADYQLARAHEQIDASVAEEKATFESALRLRAATEASTQNINTFTDQLGQSMPTDPRLKGPGLPREDEQLRLQIKDTMRNYISAPADQRRRLQRATGVRLLASWMGVDGPPKSLDELAHEEGISIASTRKKIFDASQGLRSQIVGRNR